LNEDPYSGHVFVFRGRRGDLVKVQWWTGDGLCLLCKRLERGRFVWPQASEGTVTMTQAQLSMARPSSMASPSRPGCAMYSLTLPTIQ
jgi:transposase